MAFSLAKRQAALDVFGRGAADIRTCCGSIEAFIYVCKKKLLTLGFMLGHITSEFSESLNLRLITMSTIREVLPLPYAI